MVLHKFVDPWLKDPDTDEMKPCQEKLGNEIAKGNFPLQFDSFDRFGYKVDAIKNAEHGKKMQWENNSENAKYPNRRFSSSL